jgi:hypothetical protein
MRFFLMPTVLIVLLAADATEASAYTIAGAGTHSCVSWSAHRREFNLGSQVTKDSQQEASWVLGFLSGIGFIHNGGDDPLRDVDAEGVWAWIDSYCQARPIDKISQAAQGFYLARPPR